MSDRLWPDSIQMRDALSTVLCIAATDPAIAHQHIKGADIGIVWELPGRSISAMTRRYLGHVCRAAAARDVPTLAPI